MSTPELQKIFLVTISYSDYRDVSYPKLRWIVTGVTNNLAAIRVVMRTNINISPAHYDLVECKELKSTYAGTDIRVVMRTKYAGTEVKAYEME